MSQRIHILLSLKAEGLETFSFSKTHQMDYWSPVNVGPWSVAGTVGCIPVSEEAAISDGLLRLSRGEPVSSVETANTIGNRVFSSI